MPGIRFKVDGSEMKSSIANMRRNLTDLGVSAKMTEKEISALDKKVGQTAELERRRGAFDKLTKSLGLSGIEAELFAKKYNISLGKAAKDKSIEQMNYDLKTLGITSKVTGNQLASFEKKISRTTVLDKKKKAFESLTKSMGLSTKESEKFAKQFGINLKDADKSLMGYIKSINGVTKAIVGLAASYAALKAYQFIKSSTMDAARYQVLGSVLETVGVNAGKTRGEMNSLAKDVQGTGISMISSRQALIQMTIAELDLTKATELARLAQHAAVVGQINSSEAFQNLVRGIQSGATEILKTMGINVNFDRGYKKLAQTLKKTTADLTEQEKVISRMNTVLAEGAMRAGIYEAAMGDVGKKISSLPRYIEDLKVTVGEPFLPGLNLLVDQVTLSLKDLKKEAEDPALQASILAISGLFFDLATAAVKLTASGLDEFLFPFIFTGKVIATIFYEVHAALNLVQTAILKTTDLAARGALKLAKFSGNKKLIGWAETRVKKTGEVSREVWNQTKESIRKGIGVWNEDYQLQKAKVKKGPQYFKVPADTAGEAATAADIDAIKKAQDVIDGLKFEYANLSRNATQQEIYNQLKSAGIAINTKKGESISDLVVKINEEKLAQQEALTNEEFANNRKIKSVEDWVADSERLLNQHSDDLKKAGVYQGIIDEDVKKQRLANLNTWHEKQKNIVILEVALEKKKSKGAIDEAGLTNRKLAELEDSRLEKEKAINRESVGNFKTTTETKRAALLNLYRSVGDYSAAWREAEFADLQIKANALLNQLGDTPENRALVGKQIGQQTREIEEKPKAAADTEKLIGLRKDLVKIDMDELSYQQGVEQLAKNRLNIYEQQYKIESDKLDRMAHGIGATAEETSAYNSQAEALSNINKELLEQKQLLRDRTAQGGAMKALRDYSNEAGNLGAQVGEVFTQTFTALEDKLVEFCHTGKMSFTDLVDSISADILKLMIKTQITAPLANWLTGGSGGGGGLIGSLIGVGTSFLGGGGAIAGLYGAQYQSTGVHHTGIGPGEKAKSYRMMPAGAFDNAPRFHSGVGPNERKAIIEKTEGVFTSGQMGAMAPVSSIIDAMKKAGGNNKTGDISISIPVTVTGNGNGGMNIAAMKKDIEETVISVVRKYADA